MQMKDSLGEDKNSCWPVCWKEVEIFIFLSLSPEQVEAGLSKLLEGTTLPFKFLTMLLPLLPLAAAYGSRTGWVSVVELGRT